MSLVFGIQNLASQLASDLGSVDKSLGKVSNLTTVTKTNMVAGINSLLASIEVLGASIPAIDDEVVSANKMHSSQRITDLLNLLRDEIMAGADSAHNTLQKIEALLVQNDQEILDLITALQTKVSFAAEEIYPADQQLIANTNINVGDVTTDQFSKYLIASDNNTYIQPGYVKPGYVA